jgi:hypothetical protein
MGYHVRFIGSRLTGGFFFGAVTSNRRAANLAAKSQEQQHDS